MEERGIEYAVELVVIAGADAGRRFTIAGHETFLVGRSNAAHLRLDDRDKHISRNHFLIEVNPPCCRIVDLKSNNGTFVNGERVADAILNDGDEIRAGQTRLQVHVAGAVVGPIETIDHIPARRAGAVEDVVDLADAVVEESDLPPKVPGYSIIRELGRGGMGTVYLARDDGGRDVALKLVKNPGNATAAQIARFLREASILGQLDHPNIVRFRAMGEVEDRPYFAMDYVAGVNAAQFVKRQCKTGTLLSAKSAVRIIGQVLRGLEHAHARRFVHRDIKPGNILIGEGKTGKKVVKLADFGLARVYQASRLSGLTLHGDVGGTVAYMPPEQITNYREVSPAADQYSAAATLYFMLTGKMVYDFDASPMDPLARILQDDPVPIQSRRADISDDLAEMIHRALLREPRHRFADASAFREALLDHA